MRWLSPPDSVPELRGHGEVVEADVVQEAQPLADLLEDAHGDLVLLGREMAGQVGEPLVGLADRHLADLADVLAGDLHGERLRLQAVAVAGGQGVADMKRSISSRIQADSVSFQRRSRLGITPSKVLVVL